MLTHHTKRAPMRRACVSRSRVHSRRRRMMFRCADYTLSGTARAGGEVTHPLQWSSEVHASDLAHIYYKTADGCKAGWTCAKHAPGGRGAEGRVRIKTPDGCKGGWTCANLVGVWNRNYGRGKNTGPHNCGGYLCRDWAFAFENAALKLRRQGYISWVVDYLSIAKNPEAHVGDTVHVYAKICVSGSNNDDCCLSLDDGFNISGKYFHDGDGWYSGWYPIPPYFNEAQIQHMN